MNRLSTALVLCLSMAIVGCGGDDEGGDDGGSPSSTSSATGSGGQGGGMAASTGVGGGAGGGGGQGAAGGGGGSSGPSVEMTVMPDTIAAGDTVTATVTVMNFVLEPPGAPNEDGHGHFHIYLDGATGTGYLIADQVPSVPLTIPANTTAGAHTLRVSLGQNNHAPLSPNVEDIVDITVQ